MNLNHFGMKPPQFINSIEELRYYKEQAQIKSDKKLQKLEKKFKRFKENATANKVIDELLDGIGVQSQLLPTLLPLALKYRSALSLGGARDALRGVSKRKILLFSLYGLSVGLTSYLFFTDNTPSSSSSRRNTESNDEQQLFI